MSFKVEVIADNSGKWCGNSLTFDTLESAHAYATDLFSRWTAVREWRILDSRDLICWTSKTGKTELTA
jgi:hypothetical protein